MAAVLLRRVFLQLEYKDMVNDIDAGVLKGCQAELLIAIQAETNSLIQRKICDAVAELARSCIGKFIRESIAVDSLYSPHGQGFVITDSCDYDKDII